MTKTQGDRAMRSDTASLAWDVYGDGIKIGVISDSYNTLFGDPAGTDLLNGDLPGVGNPNFTTPVEIVEEYPYGRRTDEGRAMLQIIHDIAPKATLAFHTGFVSAGNFAEGLVALDSIGCDIIVDDVTYITEPFFDDGVVSKAVDKVVANGTTYISAAGNFGTASYEGVFAPTAAPAGYVGTAHNFGGGDIYQNINFKAGTYTIVLQWQDSIYSLGQLPGVVNDLDIYLIDNAGNRLFGFNRNNIWGDPLEILPFVVSGNTNANIMITRKWGSQNVKFKYVIFRGDATINEYANGGSTIVGHPNAEGAIAVGAVLYTNTPAFGVSQPSAASFSSRGGTEVKGAVRQKPDIMAPNGVNTTVYLGGQNIDGDLFPNFFGTSAAAPHIAAVAGLLQEANKKF